MRKAEILTLHENLVDLKDAFVQMGHADEETFKTYAQVDVSPSDIGRSKEVHKKAVFALGSDLAAVISDDEFSDAGRIKARMDELFAEAL